MAFIVLALAALLGQAGATMEAQTCTSDRQATIQPGAEAMLGGILGMQFGGANGYGCGSYADSMQWYEALRYSLDLVNKKDEFLNGQYLDDYYVPGVRMGMNVVNTCDQKDLGVSAVSTLFPSLSADERSCAPLQSNMTLGIVASIGSSSSGAASEFADKFDIPMVSFDATAPTLTLSGMYPNFMRTIPHDKELMEVMGHLLKRLDWTYIVVIYQDNLYGRAAFEALRPASAENGICISAAIMVDGDDLSMTAMRNVLQQAVATDTVGVVYLGGGSLISALLKEGLNVAGAGMLQWIVTDSVALDISYDYDYPNGILALVPASRYIVEFEDHWVRIDEENPSPENPWFQAWYMERYQCNLGASSTYGRPCSTIYQGLTVEQIERKKRLAFVQDLFVEPAVHSVFAYAYALRKAQQDLCTPPTGICSTLAALSHEDFMNTYLKKVDFTYAARERVPSLASDQYAPYKAAKRLVFDAHGDIESPSFSVWNYNNLPVGEEDSVFFKFREVGNYINGRLSLSVDDMRMYTEDRLTPLPSLLTSPCPTVRGCSPCLGVPKGVKYYFQDGDIVIHGIFSLHDMGPYKYTCADLASSVHPLYLEAMIYAVKRVNQDQSILRGVTLGGLGIDDCMDPDLSSNFIMQVQNGWYMVHDQAGNYLDPLKVKAYTGAYSPPLTLPLADLMDLLMKPLVGYRATSAQLDSYAYYLKTVPSIEEEFRAILMIMKQHGWMFTQLLFSTDAYSHDDVDLFRHMAAQVGICVVASNLFDASHRQAVDMLAVHETVKPVVLLLSPHNHRELLRVLNDTGAMSHHYQFIATTTLGNDARITEDFEEIAQGFISIDITYSSLTRFYDELGTLRVDTYQENPWFEEWFESVYECYVGDNPHGYASPCDTSVGINDAPGFMRDMRVVHVINAVYAIARGLDTALTRHCGAGYSGVCAQFTSAGSANSGMQMVEDILGVSFDIEDTTPTQTFRFSHRGGAYDYNVYSYIAGVFTRVVVVSPSAHSITVVNAGALPEVPEVPSSCPKPCAECLYMFAFQQYWYIDGDLIIPAVFDVHYQGPSMYGCGRLRADNGVQYTEAFKFALDYVNTHNILRDVTLGGLAFDGCSNPTRSLAIVNGVMGGRFPVMDDHGNHVDISKLVSWLTYDSESTMGAADVLKMIDMPLVSPGATAPQLWDKTRYSTFFRTIPSDLVIARAMATFIQQRGWKYVITLNAPDDGDRQTRDMFRQYLQDKGICVVASLEFETDGSSEVILNSIHDSTTQVVVVFADPHQYVRDLLLAKEQLFPENDVIFLGNHFWDLQRMGLTRFFPQNPVSVATDSLSFRMRNPTVTEFVDYLRGLRLTTSENPWLIEYYQALYRCDFGDSTMYGTSCSSSTMDLGGSSQVYQHTYSLSTINAVHALAEGLSRVLMEKCGASYSGVCGRFLTDSDTTQRLMAAMDNETFTDVAGIMFDFVQREVNRGFEVMQHDNRNNAEAIATVDVDENLAYTPEWVPSKYAGVRSECSEECLVCEGIETNFRDFTFIQGDLYIVGLFDVHTEGSTPYTCGSLNHHQGLELLEAFHYAVEYLNQRRDLFAQTLRSVPIGAVGIDTCSSPTRAANLVANIHSGNIQLTLSGGLEINRRQILAYVGPFTTASTIRVADILNAIGIPQVTYGATGLHLQDQVNYPYLLRSVPADDKQARAIISYLKNFNLTNVQVVTSREPVGLSMTREFMRLAPLNLVCIKENYTMGEVYEESVGSQADRIVQKIVRVDQAKVVVLLMDDPLPVLQAAGQEPRAREDILWIATDKWGYDISFLEKLQPLLGNRDSRKNVVIFDVETADIIPFDVYLEDKVPSTYTRNPWFAEYYEEVFRCSAAGASPTCGTLQGLSRHEDYVQDPYVLYVVNAVFSLGLGIDGALKDVCGTFLDGICPEFEVTGDRRDIVLQETKKVNFTDYTLQPFYFEPTGESSRGYHIYNVTANYDQIIPGNYMFENVGSYNDTHFLKLDITYDLPYEAYCTPYENCECVVPFPEYIPSRYMLQASPLELNLVYIGDVHQPHPTDPFACSHVNVGADFFKMMAFYYAIDRVNENLDNNYPESLHLGGIALDTCSTTLRLEQDIFNLLSGNPLCDTTEQGQLVPPSSVVAFVPDGNTISLSVSSILASSGITSVSPSATSPNLRDFVMSDHFLTVVPPDDVLATAIRKLMAEVQWDYASVIYSMTPSMTDAQNVLLHQTTIDQTACIGQSVSLPMDADLSDAEAVLDLVSQQVGARAVVLYTLPEHTRLLLQASRSRGQTGRFVWIVTTPWGYDDHMIEGLEEQASGAIILQPYASLLSDFRSFVKSLTFTERHGIPDDWFEEIYQTLHSCKIEDSEHSLPFASVCSKEERITDDMVPYEPAILHTVIAVYMVAQGLNKIPACQESTYDISACISRLQNRDSAIYQAILTAQWNVLPDLLGNQSFSFSFTDEGYGNIGFEILNYHLSPALTGYTYTSLGRYTDMLDFNAQGYQGISSYQEGWIPVSNCLGTGCQCQGPHDMFGVPEKWTLSPSLSSITDVEEGKTYLDPVSKELYYVETVPDVTTRFSDLWGVAVVTLAGIGMFVSLCLFIYLLVVYPVRGGTSVLGYVLSFGIILLYAMVFAFVAHATEEICALRRFALGLCYAIVYCALFVKLVDCWRSQDKEDMFEVKYRKLGRPLGLFMVTVMLVLVQVMINTEWLILEEPEVVRIFYNDQYWPRCTPDDFYDEGLMFSLCYVMVIILLTVLIGFCTFNNTKNHREARWILGMAVLAIPTWVIWCAWAALGAIKTRDAAVCVGLLINATVLLLLGPVRKLYLLNKYQALIEEEERETRQQDRANKDGLYSSVYEHHYDNSPQFHDRGSTMGSARGYPPSSVAAHSAH